MSTYTPSGIFALAKKQLGLSQDIPDIELPSFYLQELERHLMLYPDAHNFRVTLQPAVGLGSVTCLEDDCGQNVPLISRMRSPNGGIKDGMGSLSAYRAHFQKTGHSQIRVKAEPSSVVSFSSNEAITGTSSMSIKAVKDALPSVLGLLPATTHSSSGVIKYEDNQDLGSNILRIKAEPVEERLWETRKRLSDVAFPSEDREDRHEGSSLAPFNAKKFKTETTVQKQPLNLVTNTSIASESRVDNYMDSSVDNFDDPQTVAIQLENVRVAISGQHNLVDQLMNRGYLTDREMWKIEGHQEEITRLKALERRLTTNVPSWSANVVHPTQYLPVPPTKPEVDDMHSPFKINGIGHSSYASSSSVPQTFPIPMDVDHKPIDFLHGIVNPPSRMPGAFTIKDESGREEWAGFCSNSSESTLSTSSPHNFEAPRDNHSDDLPFMNPYERLGIRFPPNDNLDDPYDSDGNFRGRGRDMFVGPQASVTDIDDFLVEAGNAESFDGNATVEKALQYLGLTNLQDKLPGMEITLMPHQTMGVVWMLEKEKSVIKGGCLADEMGLGKTVQTIATIVTNRSKDSYCKTTLIVAPVALLDQWKEEIEAKTNCGLKCLIYHGPSRTKSKPNILQYDVVLTTYHTMAHEWPDYENQMKKKAKAKKKGDDFVIYDSEDEKLRNHSYRSEKRKKQCGLLFQIDWYRIILDEGQNIRNRRTRISRAATDLRSTYYWCLTGTPIINSLIDIYGIMRFIKLRPWYDWAEFHGHIGRLERKNTPMAVMRLQKVMGTFLLRRKKDSKLDGKNLIDLPQKKVELVSLEFTEEEREIYNMVEARSQASFNRFLRAGTVLKNYHQVLVLLLRLRQICSHPSLIQENSDAFISPEESKLPAKHASILAKARHFVGDDFVTKVKQKFLEDALDCINREKQSEDATVEDECPICYDAMTDAIVTACTHEFCKSCIDDVLLHPLPEDNDYGCKLNQRPCPVCRTPISKDVIFDRQAFQPSDDEIKLKTGPVYEDMSDECTTSDRKGKGQTMPRKTRSSRVVNELDDEGDVVFDSQIDDTTDGDDNDDTSDFIAQSDEDEEEIVASRTLKKRLGKKRATVVLDSDDELDSPEIIFGIRKNISKTEIKTMPCFLPSTKMKYMMEALQKRVESNPEEKTLIVSQWTGCLDLVSDYLQENNIPHVKYQGDMSRLQRDLSVRTFMSKEKARVMLMSSKCGGVGLNLTRANNVISLDLGWSQAVEAQAFDRVHRMGQTREVLIERIVISNTVEDRILALQETKQALADGSLGEGNGKKIGKLSVKELANLFGLDARGRRLQ